MVDFWGGMLQSNREIHEKSLKFEHKPINKESCSDTKSKSTLFRSVLNSGNDFISELHSKLNAALSLDVDEEEDNGFGDDDDDDDSIFEECARQKQRDSGGDFGGSSSTTSECGMGGGSHSAGSSLSHGREGIKGLHQRDSFTKYKIRMPSYHYSNHSHKGKSESPKSVATVDKKIHHKHRQQITDSDAVSSTESTSEPEINEPSMTTTTSIDSSSLGHSASEGSLLSWTSSLSCDSQTDESTAGCMEFMKQFVEKLFHNNTCITLEEKAKFGELCRGEVGRLWFSRYVNTQRVNNKKVSESTFYSLVQYFAIALFECAEADDYTPAKSLMNMCFTFYHEVAVPGCEPYKEFLYLYLKEQPIWQSLRFWNAAFFDAVQCERAHKPVATREDLEQYSPEEMTDERQFQENITFGQLGSFTCNMHAFGLTKELCLEFLRKQSTIANLRSDQVKMLRDNIEQMYRETQPWRR